MLELNRIYNMDCIEGLKQIDSNSVDLILTDPPWGIERKSYDKKDSIEVFSQIVIELERVLKSQKFLLLDMSFEKLFQFNEIIRQKTPTIQYRQPIILYCNNQIGHRSYVGWNHFRLIMVYARKEKNTDKFPKVPHRYRDVIEFPMVSLEEKYWGKFPNPKSVYSYKMLVRMFSNERELVFDPFMGSGTTAIACKELNRNFIGFEINPEYYKPANERLKKYNTVPFSEMF